MPSADRVHKVFKERFAVFIIAAQLYTATAAGPSSTNPDRRIEDLYDDMKTYWKDSHSQVGIKSRVWRTTAACAMLDMPTFYPMTRHNICYALADKLARKRVDYGYKGIVDFGLSGIIIRIVDKVNRIRNLRMRGGENATGESLNDAYEDIVGYSAVAHLFEASQWADDTVEDE